MNVGVPVGRTAVHRGRIPTETSGPDLRNSFIPQRYPVRLCKSASSRPSSQTRPPHDQGSSILIPRVPVVSASGSERGESAHTDHSHRLVRRRSTFRRPLVPTLGERISSLSAVEDDQARFVERHHSGLATHASSEREYLYTQRRWREGAEFSADNPRVTSRCKCNCWNRSASIWRTFHDSQQIELYSDADPNVKDVGFDMYSKCLRRLENYRKWTEKRRVDLQGNVKAG